MSEQAEINERFPYATANLTEIDADNLRVGMLIAGRGPAGSGRWLARRVSWVGRLQLFGQDAPAYKTDDMRTEHTPVKIMDRTVMIVRS